MQQANRKRYLGLFLAGSALALAAPAWAEEAAPPAKGDGIAEIVVTAQRRAQNVQDVPIAIAAISGDALTETGIRDPRDLTLLVPSLSMQAGRRN